MAGLAAGCSNSMSLANHADIQLHESSPPLGAAFFFFPVHFHPKVFLSNALRLQAGFVSTETPEFRYNAILLS
jgi:hypothetical protein